MSEWRDIWKKTINACQKTIKDNDRKCKFTFKDLENEFPNDRMIQFEKGIALECLGCYNEAIIQYEMTSNETTGLPVEHWRKVSSFFLNRVRDKKQGRLFSENLIENLNITDLYNVQWNTFYYLHSFISLPSHIRYLAISSLSRIDSEPEMVIVIFRTCVEEILRELHKKEYKEIIEINRKDLYTLVSLLYEKGEIISFHPDKTVLDHEYELVTEIRDKGNKSAHGKISDYTTGYLIETICSFLELMNYSNKVFKTLMYN